MANPVIVDIPHKLGRDSARSRLDGSIGKLADMFPGGGTVTHHWSGDTLVFTVQAMGQTIASRLEIHDTYVHAVVNLPPFLSLFAERIRAKLGKEGPKLLE